MLPRPDSRRSWLFAGKAAVVYALWTAATYWLEGRIRTFQRPEAAGDRAIYALIANIVVGTALVLWVIQRARKTTDQALPRAAGFRGFTATLRWLLVALALGTAFLALRAGRLPSLPVSSNAFVQAWPTSTAEILVCWSLVAVSVERIAANRLPRALARVIAAASASVSFGVYHIAHSPPFDSAAMVLFLTLIGGFTSLFFFVSRDVYATVVLHNFFALYGILGALEQGKQLASLAEPRADLLLLALGSLGIVLAAHRWWLSIEASRDVRHC